MMRTAYHVVILFQFCSQQNFSNNSTKCPRTRHYIDIFRVFFLLSRVISKKKKIHLLFVYFQTYCRTERFTINSQNLSPFLLDAYIWKCPKIPQRQEVVLISQTVNGCKIKTSKARKQIMDANKENYDCRDLVKFQLWTTFYEISNLPLPY